jgi:hypothetical protein
VENVTSYQNNSQLREKADNSLLSFLSLVIQNLQTSKFKAEET